MVEKQKTPWSGQTRRQALEFIIWWLAWILLSPNSTTNSKQHPTWATHTIFDLPSIPIHKTISDLSKYILSNPKYFPRRIINIKDTNYCELTEYDITTQDLIHQMISTCQPWSWLEESIVSTMMSEYYDGNDDQYSHRSDLAHAINIQMRKSWDLRPDEFVVIDMTDSGRYIVSQDILTHINRAKEWYTTPPSPVILGTQYEAQDEIFYTLWWVDKMYFNHAKALLDSYNIHTKSTAHWYMETWSRSNSDETCLQWVNLTTVDGLIQLVKLFRRWNDEMIVTNRWMTELGHTPGTYSHANGYKVDIARLGISWLMFWLMIEQHCAPVSDTLNQRTLTISDDWWRYYYHILHHDWHFDIMITGFISDSRKQQILNEIKNINNPSAIQSTFPSRKYMKFDQRKYIIPQTNIT